MSLQVSENLSETDEAFIVDRIREFNQAFARNNHRELSVVSRNDHGEMVGGLMGKTFWNYLYVSILWVHEDHRGEGLGSKLLSAAEEEALQRDCKFALLDTYSFQARPFYERLGYEVFGSIEGFAGAHQRHYLRKSLVPHP